MQGTTIIDFVLREVLDSRGLPTIEAEIHLENGAVCSAIAPSGASTGSHEAMEKRDGDHQQFLGKGVEEVILKAYEELAEEIIGMDALEQRQFDMMLIEVDGTDQKSSLGANVMIALSLAVARAAATSRRNRRGQRARKTQHGPLRP